jgi:hypothetical protein
VTSNPNGYLRRVKTQALRPAAAAPEPAEKVARC